MSAVPMPPVFLHVEDEKGGCATFQKITPPMTIDNDILTMDLSNYRAKPKIGPASEMAAVRVQIRNGEVLVFAIYKDPMKTATMGCCSGSGCYCCATGCYCVAS